MTDYSENTRRIAKNTLMLYFRMFFLMILGVFSSRIVLEALGETDYGIYSVVGGVVAMFSLVSGSLTATINRFLAFEMGLGESAQMGKVYSTAVNVQILLSVLIVIIAEPVGLWFIDNKMTIPPDRIEAARFVMHFSLLSFVINLLSVPQMAAITAHEKMSAYAWVGMLDGILRFGAALVISVAACDRLVLYGTLMAGVVLAVRCAYGIYCRKFIPDCRYHFIHDKSLLKQMTKFAGWSFIGVTSGVLRDQGGNILVNMFFTPAVNAARALAFQLNGAVQNFVTNFMTAVNPQITKSYSAGDYDYMHSLIRRSSRMSFYLLFILSLPIFFNTDFLLGIWLASVPETTSSFVKLFIVFALSESISNPLITAMLATDNIKKYQIVVGGLQLLNLPVSYIFLKIGYPPQTTVAVAIVISQICLAARLVMLRKMINLSVRNFIKRIYLNIWKVGCIGSLLTYMATRLLPTGTLGSCLSLLICVLIAFLSCAFVGMSSSERLEVIAMLKNRMRNDQDN